MSNTRRPAPRARLQLLEQALEDVALAGLGGDHVPQVADLGLADAVDAPKRCSSRLGFHGRS